MDSIRPIGGNDKTACWHWRCSWWFLRLPAVRSPGGAPDRTIWKQTLLRWACLNCSCRLFKSASVQFVQFVCVLSEFANLLACALSLSPLWALSFPFSTCRKTPVELTESLTLSITDSTSRLMIIRNPLSAWHRWPASTHPFKKVPRLTVTVSSLQWQSLRPFIWQVHLGNFELWALSSELWERRNSGSRAL